ncbi:MAG: hypothetical protein R2864_00445 [Syntrophotaleaceae bacterium]
MELEICLFVFAEDGTVTPLDKKRFDKAVDHLEPLPEFSGRCIKVAGAMLDRSQSSVIQEIFGQYVFFDDKGMVSEEKLNEASRYNDKIAEEGYHNDFIWTPNEDERSKIEAALG